MLWYFCWNIQFGFIIENRTLLQFLGQAWISRFQKSQKLVVGCLDVIVGDHNVKVAFACSIPGFNLGHAVLTIYVNRHAFFILIDMIGKDSDDSGVYEWYRKISLHIRRTLAQDDFCLWLIWQRYRDIRVVVKSKLTSYRPLPGSKLIFACDWSLMIIKMILRWKLTAYPPHPGSAFFPMTLQSLCLDLNRF